MTYRGARAHGCINKSEVLARMQTAILLLAQKQLACIARAHWVVKYANAQTLDFEQNIRAAPIHMTPVLEIMDWLEKK